MPTARCGPCREIKRLRANRTDKRNTSGHRGRRCLRSEISAQGHAHRAQVTLTQGSQFCDSKAFTLELMVAYIGPMDMFVARTWSLFASGVL